MSATVWRQGERGQADNCYNHHHRVTIRDVHQQYWSVPVESGTRGRGKIKIIIIKRLPITVMAADGDGDRLANKHSSVVERKRVKSAGLAG